MALEDGDLVTLTHRGHAMSIGMGIDLNKMMAELMGKATGFCKGKGGSMHIVDVDAGNLGSNGVVGGGLTLAPGAALTQKYKKTGKIVLCSFGDGASNEGSFHEGVNLSSVWKLPVIFNCENNLYGMSTHHTKVMNVKNVADRASSYGIQSFIVDGYDAEGQLTSAIQYVTMDSTELPVIYQVSGHGETALSGGFTEAIEKANITLSDLALLKEDAVPEDAAALIINGPTTDFSEVIFRHRVWKTSSQSCRHAAWNGFPVL